MLTKENNLGISGIVFYGDECTGRDSRQSEKGTVIEAFPKVKTKKKKKWSPRREHTKKSNCHGVISQIDMNCE